jgi:membrane-associated phospholipid phosphatase
VAVAAAAGALVVALYVAGHPFIPQDATLEDDIQSTDWGPLALTFPVFSWIGDAKGAILEGVVFVVILVVNRRAWLLAIAGALTGGWYVLLSHLIDRARPTTAQVLRVTEHPSASSFPSGHTIFVITIATVIMLCLGHRYLPRWARPIGWAVVGLLGVANGISRIYTGAHWPTDVLAGILIAVSWLCFVVSLRWISARALAV